MDFVHDFSSARASSAETSFQSANPSQLEKENVIFRSEPWRRVSLALFCFHALLLERNRYTNLGFSGIVEFTYYDLKSALILIKVLGYIIKLLSFRLLFSISIGCYAFSQGYFVDLTSIIGRRLCLLCSINSRERRCYFTPVHRSPILLEHFASGQVISTLKLIYFF